MPHIFISYRRSDSESITGRIYDHLSDAFGDDDVFQDVEDIPAGVNFKTYLQDRIATYDTMLVIIGKSWLTVADESGARRLDNPDDFVRIEVEAALMRRDMQIIPVLVNGASMPRGEDLPDALKDLHFRNAMQVRHNPDFNTDIDRLIDEIRHADGASTAAETARRMLMPGLATVLIVALIAVIAGGILLMQSGDEPTATPSMSTSEGQTAFVHTNRPFVNVFTEPDSESRIVGVLTNNETVTHFPETATDEWVQVETDEFTGWVVGSAIGLDTCAYVADGYDAPVGTESERRSSKIWPGAWYDATPFGETYELAGIVQFHSGADLNLLGDEDRDAPVYAVADGTVGFADTRRVWGNVIVIRHDPVYTCDGEVFYTRYAHVGEMLVSEGDRVKRGQQIATVGNGEGNIAYHLHFDVSRSPGLQEFPLYWPSDDKDGLMENFVDPMDVIVQHRPADITD